MLRMYDGFAHWEPGGAGVILPALDAPSSPRSADIGPTQHFWTGYGGSVSTPGGRLLLSGTDPYLFVTLDTQAKWVAGVRFRQSSLFDSWGSAVIRIRDCASFYDLCCVSVDSSGYVVIYAGNQEIELARSASPLVATGTDYYLEFKLDTGVSPVVLEARIDGVVVARATPSAALSPIAHSANQVMLSGARSFKDFYLLDGSNGAAFGGTDYLGDCVVELWLPSADSEDGAMAFSGGSPVNSGVFALSGFGVGEEPGSAPPASSGHDYSDVVGSQYPAGDGNWIGTQLVNSPVTPIVFAVDRLAALSDERVFGASMFMVAEDDGGSPSFSAGCIRDFSVSPFWTVGGLTSVANPTTDSWKLMMGEIQQNDDESPDTAAAWTTASLAASRWGIYLAALTP